MKKINDRKYLYTAFFLDPEELTLAMGGLEGTPLFKPTAVPHVTVEFRPEQLHSELFGKKAKITVTGYGNDGKNEGLKVIPETDNPELNALINFRYCNCRSPVRHYYCGISYRNSEKK